MSSMSAFDISVSGMVAQRTRLKAIASNVANISSTRQEDGTPGPYQPRFVVFQADEYGMPDGAAKVEVSSVEIDTEAQPQWRYQPDHPDAIKSGPKAGYVAYPGINLTEQMVDSMEATRAYEANVGAIETTRDLMTQALKILA